MVLAGPGSGKTTVITQRVAFLTGECGVQPERVLVITFTKAAAEEMESRYRMLNGGFSGVAFGTFHALFFKIVKYAYRYEVSDILTEEERYRYIGEISEKMKLEGRDGNDFRMLLSGEISRYKNSEESREKNFSAVVDDENFLKVYAEFSRKLNIEKKIDFEDMMLKCLRLFEERPDILEYWQNCYDYILVDEYQDICPLQYKLIKLLAMPHKNLFVVGDDDQSIYSFRGADPSMCGCFEKDFGREPHFKRLTLGLNYRCAGKIVAASDRLISHNKKRYKKLLRSADGDAMGGTVQYRSFDTLDEQNAYITDMLEILSREGIPGSQTAILYRTNTQPRQLITELKKKGIPFIVKESIPNIFEHWTARNINAYMRLADLIYEKCGDDEAKIDVCPLDREMLLGIINRPKRYVSRECMKYETMTFESLFSANRDKSFVLDKLRKLKYDLGVIARLNTFGAVKYIRKAVGYEDYVDEYAKEHGVDAASLYERLDEIEANARACGSFPEWEEYIREYGETLRRMSAGRQKTKTQENDAAVRLLTFHSSKGLEFDTVFIADVSEGFMPYRQAQTAAEYEEERRMFYVAMTRAKKRLYLLHSDERYGRKYLPSRFIGEIQMTEKQGNRLKR